MPCENCSTQFTVFKRKKSCSECRRLYCSNCLIKRSSNSVLCGRCVIFRRRPISKIELQKLKPKDLIFYLQSKHISTTGCVEKDELVNLVVAHVNGSTNSATSPNHSTTGSSGSGGTAGSGSYSFNSNTNDNPFDSIKQTCHNLFTSFTEKIVNDFSFDTPGGSRSTAKSPTSRSSSTNTFHNNNTRGQTIFSQPTKTTRSGPCDSSNNSSEAPYQPNSSSISSNLSVGISPTAISNPNGQPDTNIFQFPNTVTQDTDQQRQTKSGKKENERPGPSGQLYAKSVRLSKDDDISSSTSSFEEVGAIGGGPNATTNGENGGTTSNSSDMTDNWLFIQKNNLDAIPKNNRVINSAINLPSQLLTASPTPIRCNKISRRYSDTFIMENTHFNTLSVGGVDVISHSSKRARKCCKNCDKSRVELRRILDKFRAQLEEGESEKIENLLKSIEDHCMSPNSTSAQTPESETQIIHYRRDSRTAATQLNGAGEGGSGTDETDENTGIYVYPTINFMFDDHSANGFGTSFGGSGSGYDGDTNGHSSTFQTKKINRRLTLNDITSKADLHSLSVKQLKEILMLNRVDFKGCCEKSELLERVYRLWREHKTTPAVEKLTTEDLCKICMDAPIECVILECGHMVTCTSCGKVLNECPICRQYIVRVVRFFRA